MLDAFLALASLYVIENTQCGVELRGEPEGNPWERHTRELFIAFHSYDKLPEQVNLHKQRVCVCVLAGVPDMRKAAGARIPTQWPSSSNQATPHASTNFQWPHLKDLPVEFEVLLGSWAPIPDLWCAQPTQPTT